MRWKQSLTSISIAEKFHHSRQIESYEVKICYKLCGVASLLKARKTIFIVPITLPQSESCHVVIFVLAISLPMFDPYLHQRWTNTQTHYSSICLEK